jgi:hypothetical protein
MTKCEIMAKRHAWGALTQQDITGTFHKIYCTEPAAKIILILNSFLPISARIRGLFLGVGVVIDFLPVKLLIRIMPPFSCGVVMERKPDPLLLLSPAVFVLRQHSPSFLF